MFASHEPSACIALLRGRVVKVHPSSGRGVQHGLAGCLAMHALQGEPSCSLYNRLQGAINCYLCPQSDSELVIIKTLSAA